MHAACVALVFVVAGAVACSSEGGATPPTDHFRRSDGAAVEAGSRPSDASLDSGKASVEGSSGEAGSCVPGGALGNAIAVACAQKSPGRLAVDSQNVYWTLEEAGEIVMKAPLAGGAAGVLAADTSGAFGIAIDPNYVYFTQPSAGRVMRVPITGAGGAVPIATAIDSPLHLASDAKYLYFTGGKSVGSIRRLALLDGAVPVTLVDGLSAPRAITVDDTYVYWTDFVEGTVMRAPKEVDDSGPRALPIAFGLTQPSDLVVSGGYAYFPDHTGRLLRVDVAGGLAEELAHVSGSPFGVAVDGSNLYFTTLGDGGVFRVALTGERDVQTLAGAQADPHFLAVAPAFVYWGNWGRGGSIGKVRR